MSVFKDHNLYLVISREYIQKPKDALEVAESAVNGGIDTLQMREKNTPKSALLALGKSYLEICRKNNVVFIVNDDPYLVKEIGADGLHIGQEDFSSYTTGKLRNIVGDKLIGISTHSLEQFQRANDDDFDYISFGPIFPTKTKNYFIGSEEVTKVLRIACKPVVFIGGINIGNVDILLKQGAKNIALIRDIVQADNIKERAGLFKQKLIKKRKLHDYKNQRQNRRSGSRN